MNTYLRSKIPGTVPSLSNRCTTHHFRIRVVDAAVTDHIRGLVRESEAYQTNNIENKQRIR